MGCFGNATLTVNIYLRFVNRVCEFELYSTFFFPYRFFNLLLFRVKMTNFTYKSLRWRGAWKLCVFLNKQLSDCNFLVPYRINDLWGAAFHIALGPSGWEYYECGKWRPKWKWVIDQTSLLVLQFIDVMPQLFARFFFREVMPAMLLDLNCRHCSSWRTPKRTNLGWVCCILLLWYRKTVLLI